MRVITYTNPVFRTLFELCRLPQSATVKLKTQTLPMQRWLSTVQRLSSAVVLP